MPAVMQKSFNSGEWAPQLYARVDLEKYRAGAALLENFFVDYRGGASSRTGTEYVLQTFKSSGNVRLIPFTAAENVNYILEFGDQYIRFFIDQAPVLESTTYNITGITQANPGVVTVATPFAVGDWFFVTGVGGMTELNGNYFIVGPGSTGTTIVLHDLFGNPVDTTGFPAWTSGGTVDRVYTIASPYTSAEVFGIKYSQEIDFMILCHSNHPAQVLTLIAFDNWTIVDATFGSTAAPPTAFLTAATLSAGTVSWAYVVTGINSLGDESGPSTQVNITNRQNLQTTPGSVTVTWTPVVGDVAYNVYKCDVSYFGGTVPSGLPFGYIGQFTGNQIFDSNIVPNFSVQPPIGANPFSGSGVASIAQVTPGVYTTVPSVSFSGGSPTQPATATAQLGVQGTPTVGAGGSGYATNDTITLTNGVIVVVNGVSAGAITSFFPISHAGANPGILTSGATPTNPVAQVSTSGGGTGATVNLVWGVQQTALVDGGSGYTSTPTIVYNPAGATATATLAAASTANPTVPGFFQQRLVLAAAVGSPSAMDFSHPGSFFNYNVSSPIQADDAISVTLASGQLETIKSLVPTAPGLIVYTDKSSWMVTGGALGSAIGPSAIVAQRQSLVGANDLPPIIRNFDILYGSFLGSSVWDSNYNYYAQIFTGSDVSEISSHLFYDFSFPQWADAFAPFRLVWMVRNDGALLSFTFAKEEQFMAWSHHITDGNFTSVATVPETTTDGQMVLNGVYVVVERTINGNPVKYIERFADRIFGGAVANAWTVDAGLRYSGSPATTFSGGQHLAGETVTGLADGLVITPFTMPSSGTFSLSTPASVVTIGLMFEPKLQTLPIDVGDPTIQGKQKKESRVVVRVVDTLGLNIGQTFATTVAMKDFIVGNVGSLTNKVVTDLVTGDGQTIIDPQWAEQGQFCISQTLPFPATILGVIPELSVPMK